MSKYILKRKIIGKRLKSVTQYQLPSSVDGYWSAVTDIPCPRKNCSGTIRWHEAGYVPGYRICDACNRHFLAGGTESEPTLTRVPGRRG